MTGPPGAPLSETAPLYDRIAPEYQRLWAPVIAPAGLRLLDELEERELFEALDAETRDRVERLWRARLDRLTDADLLFRDRVAYVGGAAALPR